MIFKVGDRVGIRDNDWIDALVGRTGVVEVVGQDGHPKKIKLDHGVTICNGSYIRTHWHYYPMDEAAHFQKL